MYNPKTTLRLLCLSLAILLLTANVFAQNSPASVIPADKPNIAELSKITEAALIRGCASAIEEIKAGRAHVASLEKENDALKTTLAAKDQKIELLQSALTARQEEAALLRSSLDEFKKAIEEMKRANELQAQRVAKLEASAKRRGKLALALGVAGFVGGLLLK